MCVNKGESRKDDSGKIKIMADEYEPRDLKYDEVRDLF